MKRSERLEQQRELIIKHHLKRCKRTGRPPRNGELLPRLVTMYHKAWRKLLDTGAVEVLGPIPHVMKKKVLMVDVDKNVALMHRKDAALLTVLRRYEKYGYDHAYVA